MPPSQSKPNGSPLAAAAEAYAKNNWYVFPVKPRDKTPLTPHGLKDATTNIDVVRQWWAKWPEANIGLNCGKSGMVVVDLDKHGDKDGMEEWEQLQASTGLHTATSTSLTGGGGRHLIFKAPHGVSIKNSAGKLSPGIDVRAEGGYIVLPPSIHPSGKPYAWEDPTTTGIEELPAPIIEILTTEPDPWKIYTLKDAAQPRPPLVWVVDGIVSVGSLQIWYGAPGSLKSMILADLSVCVSAGKNWLSNPKGKGGYKTVKSAVMWLDFDNGSRRTHERFGALAKSHGTPQDAPLFYVSMPEPTLDAGDTESMGALANRIIARDVALVVIDNLGVVSGSADENSAEMQKPMGGLRWLAETTGAAVIVLHHQRKSNGNDKARAGDTLRGHSSIEAKLDLGMLITRDGTNVILSASKERGPQVKSFGATLSFENDEARELSEARFWPYDIEAADDEDLRTLKSSILSYLKRNPGDSGSAVYRDVGGNKQHVFDTIRQMIIDGDVYERPGVGLSKKLFVSEDVLGGSGRK